MASVSSTVKARFFLVVQVVLILTNSAVTWTRVWDLVAAQKWVVHSQEVRQILAQLEYLAESAQAARRRYERSGDSLSMACILASTGTSRSSCARMCGRCESSLLITRHSNCVFSACHLGCRPSLTVRTSRYLDCWTS